MLTPLTAFAQVNVSPFAPDTVVQPPGGPRIVIFGADQGGVAVLRLSVPLVEGPAEAGAGRMLAELALERMEGPARQLGARVSAERTPWGIAYGVAGAEVDLEYLTYLLRMASEEPYTDAAATERARNRILADLDRLDEAPHDWLLHRLRRAAAPELAGLAGSRASVRMIGHARLREVWARSHGAAAMSVVAWTSSDAEVLYAMLGTLGAPGEGAGEPLDAPAPTGPTNDGPTPQRAWYAEAYVDASTDDPHAAVSAYLIAAALRREVVDFEAGIRLWQLSDRTLLVVTGAARGRRISLMREAVSSAMSQLRTTLSPADVADAVAHVARQYRVEARTPEGLVGTVGRALEATGRAGGAALYLAALSEVSTASLGAYLDTLTGPLNAELRP